MKSPITSPSWAVLTSSETITLIPFARVARLVGAGDLVVVGDRDRAEPAALGRVEQHVDRRRAVRRVVGVHVQVAEDEVAARPSALAHRRLALGRMAARGDAAVDVLDRVDDPVPAELRRGALAAAAQLLAQRAGRTRGARAARPAPRRRRARTAGRARRRAASPRRPGCARRAGPRRPRSPSAPASPRARRRPTPRTARRRARAATRATPGAGPTSRTRSRSDAGEPGGRVGGSRRPHGRAPRALERRRGAARAGRGAARRAPPSSDERDLERRRARAPPARKRSRSTPGGTTS